MWVTGEYQMSTHPHTSSQHLSSVILNTSFEQVFCELITQRTGIVLQNHQLSNLHDTVRKACVHFACKDVEQLLLTLQQSEGLTTQFEYLLAGITVGESYFFRDSEQINLLRDRLLPEMISFKRTQGDFSLRIWSAGCSQGQEIYTIALLLMELIPDIHKWRIHLLGTDINSEVVAKAIRGRYSEWSFRNTPQLMRERWFIQTGREFEIHPAIKHMVHFSCLNLSADVYPSVLNATNGLDLILCRNVFIYLDTGTVQRSMTQYADCLLDQGILMLGASDPIYYRHTQLELIQSPQAGYFRKVGKRDSGIAQQVVLSIAPEENKLNAAMFSSDLPAAHPRKIASNFSSEKTNQFNISGSEDWRSVLVEVEADLLKDKENSELWQIKARALANMGSSGLALDACERSLQLDPVNKHTYLILGLILSEMDRFKEADAALRKTLYLDRSFLQGHYELGMLRVRSKDFPGALKCLENALKLAKKGGPQRELEHAAGMTYDCFAQVLQNEIAMLRVTAEK